MKTMTYKQLDRKADRFARLASELLDAAAPLAGTIEYSEALQAHKTIRGIVASLSQRAQETENLQSSVRL